MSAKHTPGPWTCGPSKYNSERLNVQAGMPSMRVLARFDGDGDGYDETDEANARLIAAAPDLLNALTGLADAAERRGIPCDAARAAIARATGGQP